MTDTERLKNAIEERLEITNGDAALVGVRIDDIQALIQQKDELIKRATMHRDRIEKLEEALESAAKALDGEGAKRAWAVLKDTK